MSRGLHRRALLVALLVLVAPGSALASSSLGAADDGGLTDRARVVFRGSPARTQPAPTAHAARIVGGGLTPIRAVPWQVDVWSETSSSVTDCGGAIIDATTILTAAHCLEDTTPGAAPTKGGLAVWAGTSSISSKTATATDRLNLQERRVAKARVHPRWRARVASTGDIAVLTLASPLELDGKIVAAVPLPPEVAVPIAEVFPVAPQLTVSGYGLTSGGSSGTTDGRLRSLQIATVDPDTCDDDDNAIEICARSPAGSACSGDSGGPVVAPGPVLVGLVSNGPRACPRSGANRYAHLAVPENRVFLNGSSAPPVAPRRTGRAEFTNDRLALRVGQSLTCDGGTFDAETEQHTAVTTDEGTMVLLASGRVATIQLTADLVGHELRCRGYASSAGGISVSNLDRTKTVVEPASTAARACDGTASSPVTLTAPARARRASRITIAATLAEPSAGARAAVLILKRSVATAGSVRRVATITKGSAPKLRISYQLPRALAVGRTYAFQVVMATFPTKAAATRAAGLAGACDAGDATFRLKIVR